jgi:DNA polymerase-3 subunit beta
MVRIIKDFEKSLVSQDLEIIVPSRAVDLLRRVDDDVVISVIESKSKITHARFDVGDTVFITRLIDEKFPPYDSVIPQNNEILLVVNQKDFIAAIKRVSIFTNAVSHQIRVKIDKSNLQVVGEDEDTGSNANETVNCDYTGKKMDVGFNWVYLEEVLQNIELEENNPNVILMFSEPNRPVIIRPHSETDEILMLIMPVRL